MKKIRNKQKITITLLCTLLITLFGNLNMVKALPDESEKKTFNYTLQDYLKTKGATEVQGNEFYARAPRVYSSTVNEKKEIMDKCYNAIKNLDTIVTFIDTYNCINNDSKQGFKDLANIYFETLYEYPEIFYLSPSVSGTSYTNSSGQVVYSLNIGYEYDNDTINTMKNKLNSKIQYIRDTYLSSSNTDLKNEYIIHDYLLENCTYDEENYKNGTVPNIDHTAYGTLINGIAVCDGYAKAAKIFLNMMGIEAGIVLSDTHAWNYVNIDGNYYHMDATWDDPVPESNRIRYTYFNVSSEELASLDTGNSHKFIESDYPACTSNDFGFLRNKYYYEFRDNDRITRIESNWDINVTNLSGEKTNTVVDACIYGQPIMAYGNSIYSIDKNNSYVLAYNINTEDTDIVDEINGTIVSAFKKDKTIIVNYTENNSSTTKQKVVDIEVKEDVNEDGNIDMVDIAIVANNYNVARGNGIYNWSYDVNRDYIIDIYDICKVSKLL